MHTSVFSLQHTTVDIVLSIPPFKSISFSFSGTLLVWGKPSSCSPLMLIGSLTDQYLADRSVCVSARKCDIFTKACDMQIHKCMCTFTHIHNVTWQLAHSIINSCHRVPPFQANTFPWQQERESESWNELKWTETERELQMAKVCYKIVDMCVSVCLCVLFQDALQSLHVFHLLTVVFQQWETWHSM